ncbi:CvpA family protein [Flavobacterium gelidilacus]|uniref:CvpA family protein n=1 Tax=Flavobacterium gelidilacus TaxID=206041 RepID=UPI000428527C|nr:CvpA family protein [Flavobacterium gelidilacus]
MSFIDIIFAAFLAYALYKGIKNGLFVELASLVALLAGIFVALKFSDFTKSIIENNVSWDPKYIEIIAFALTFIAVVAGIHLFAKVLTKIADFAFLGWINKLAGAVFSMLKTILALSIVILLFEKINVNNMIAKEETLDDSIFYNPIKKVSEFVYPQIEEWYEKSVQYSADSEQGLESK